MQISWIKLSATGRETIYVSLRVFSADGTVSKCQQQRKKCGMYRGQTQNRDC